MEDRIHPVYDDTWIKNGLKKHEAKYSMVLHFETSDPKRLYQLEEFLTDTENAQYSGYQIYEYDPWNGLGNFNKKTGKINYDITAPQGAKFPKETKNEERGNPKLVNALTTMNQRLKDEKTIFILSNITPSSGNLADIEGQNLLIAALRSWANSDDLMVKKSLVILIGASVGKLLDDETRSLIASIEADLGSDEEYKNIVEYYYNSFSDHLKNKEKIDKGTVAVSLKGLNLHQAEAVLVESCVEKDTFDLEEIKKLKGDIIKNTGILEVEEPEDGFEMIGGYDEVKEFILNKIIRTLHNEKRAKKFVVPLPRGILLFGPPGTGKTLFAKALAKEVKLPFINMKTENIYSQWLGESGQRMKNAIRTAEKMSPAIVFIDEIDRFGKRTDTKDSAGEETRRVFSQMLEWLGDSRRKAIIIGTTNITTQLDDAFIRTGRFDYKIPIFYPDKEARLEILRIHSGISDKRGRKPPKEKPPFSDAEQEVLDFFQKKLVPATDLYSGAELEELVNRAKRHAFERETEVVTIEDFLKSLELFRVDTDKRRSQLSMYMKQAQEYCDDTTFLKKLGIKHEHQK